MKTLQIGDDAFNLLVCFRRFLVKQRLVRANDLRSQGRFQKGLHIVVLCADTVARTLPVPFASCAVSEGGAIFETYIISELFFGIIQLLTTDGFE